MKFKNDKNGLRSWKTSGTKKTDGIYGTATAISEGDGGGWIFRDVHLSSRNRKGHIPGRG